MAYLGAQPSKGQWRKLSDISSGFNGSATSFTLSVPPGTSQYYVTPGSASQLLISLGGVIQQPDVDYTVNTNTITFTTAPTAGLSFFGVLCGDALNAGTPADGSVTDAKLASLTTVNVTNLKNPSSASNNIVLDSSGRVGIGTNSPSPTYEQTINGNGTTIVGGLSLRNNNTETLTIGNVTATNDVDSEIWNPRNGYLRFATNNTERVRVDSLGRLLVGTFSATANGGVLQVSNGITFPAAQSACSDPNTLDDYEEGTWTPTVTGTTTAGAASYVTQVGKYTKIGNTVTVQAYINYSSGTGAGNLQISGLPFASVNAAGQIYFSGGSVSNIALTANNVAYFTINAAATAIAIDQYPVGGGAATNVAYDAAGSMGVTMSYFTAA